MKTVFRWLGIAALSVALLAGLQVLALRSPELLFAYHASFGRLALSSDRPFDPDKGAAILKEVEARLKRSPLDDQERHAVFVANAPWRIWFFFLSNRGAAALNFYPLTQNILVRHADIDHDVQFGASGKPAQSPRTFTYYITHEITHSLTGEYLGVGRGWNRGLPQWIREGYADYVGMGSHEDLKALYARYRAGDPAMDYGKSGQYARFRLLTAFFLQHEKWSARQLLDSGLSQSDAEMRMRAAMGG